MFMNACLAWVFVLFVRRPAGAWRWRDIFLAGMFTATASLYTLTKSYDDVFYADTSDGRTLVVIHDDIYAGRVDYIVYRVDPTAQRTARSTTD